MQRSLDLLTSSVLKYTTENRPVRNMSPEQKSSAAKSLGLRLLSSSGSYAMVVAEHPDMPGVVVKVVPKSDRYASFAKWMLEQQEQPTCFPRIEAVVDLPNAYMIVAEKISNPVELGDSAVKYVDARLLYCIPVDEDRPDFEELESMISYTRELHSKVGGMFDSHPGNFMRRDTGDLVFIDPLWN